MGFRSGSVVKNSLANAGDVGSIPGSKKSPGEGNGNPFSILAWEIPRTEAPGRLQSMGVQESQTWLSDATRTISSLGVCFVFPSYFLEVSRSAADPLGLALECLLLGVKNFLCPWLPAQRLWAHLGSSCHPPAGCPSRSCTEARPPGSCRSAHILHCPHTSPALKDSPGQVTCRQSSSSFPIYGQGFKERRGKGKGLVLSWVFSSLWKDVIMDTCDYGRLRKLGSPSRHPLQTGVPKQASSSSWFTRFTSQAQHTPELAWIFKSHCFNHLECFTEHTYFFF